MENLSNPILLTTNTLPIVTLSNGLRVANFSSPHNFNFVDGTILPACSTDRARSLMLESIEIETKSLDHDGVIDIELSWRMSDAVRDELRRLGQFENESFDILLVPLPVMMAMKAEFGVVGKARCIRVADRVSKTIHIDRFCL